jgi:hypothetical protein
MSTDEQLARAVQRIADLVDEVGSGDDWRAFDLIRARLAGGAS